jgi:serine/threonine-protein kinase
MSKLAPGSMVTQNVRLVSQIGEGAMGSVWLAQHGGLNTRVAVKFIAEELARDQPDMVARFRAEAAASAQIKSPYVVQTFDHGVTEDGRPYIVMEYLEGEGLGARLDRVHQLSLPQTAQVLVQVGKALDRAHRHGIIHRDIKPDNIFLSTAEDGLLCKVLDFGIAKHTKLADQKGVTLPGTTVGTPEYMSREQVMTAREVDAHADLWALAVVAYQCVTGELPFVGETLGMVCVAICKGKYTAASELRPGLPAGVDAWFAKALHNEQSERFATGKEMALAFVRLIPRDEEGEADPLLHTGQFSMPPPSTEEALDSSDIFGTGALDLFAELDRDDDAPSSPKLGAGLSLAALGAASADRPSQRGRRDGTPTFSGSSAELDPLLAASQSRTRKLKVLAVLVGIVGAVVGAVAWLSGGPTDADSGAAGSGDSSASATQTGAGELAGSGVPSAALESEGPDASHADTDGKDDAGTKPATKPYRRPGSQPSGKRPRKDLGF